jgi:REP element-mobilizing transposase RayT
MPLEPGQVPMKEPLAYFLTWTTYGTWLPGDNRGWVAKPGQFQAPDEKLKRQARRLMTDTALTLDPEQRCLVETTIADHCRFRGWRLHAVNARTQHVHVVVTAPGRHPEVVLDQFKAWCTRRLKELEQSRHPANGAIRQNWWTQRGSKKWLNDRKSLEETIQYVREDQGDPTPHPPDRPIQA